jgi:hypothetical protein
MAIATRHQSSSKTASFSLQPQGLERIGWQLYSYGTITGLLLLTTGALGILYLSELICRFKLAFYRLIFVVFQKVEKSKLENHNTNVISENK